MSAASEQSLDVSRHDIMRTGVAALKLGSPDVGRLLKDVLEREDITAGGQTQMLGSFSIVRGVETRGAVCSCHNRSEWRIHLLTRNSQRMSGRRARRGRPSLIRVMTMRAEADS